MKGRCAGCGKTGEVGQVAVHTVTCRPFAVLYAEHPERALHPGPEYVRWRAEERQAEVDARIKSKIEATDQARAVTASRFRTRNILEEDE